MIVVIEGPVGIEKDKLTQHLRKCFFDGKATIFKFSNMSDISYENYESCLNFNEKNIIFDGLNLLSEVESSVENKVPHNTLLEHLETFSLIEDLDVVYIILYSSSVELLWDACKMLGVADSISQDIVYYSNDYYYRLGKQLKKLYPHNIKLLDISTISNIYSSVEEILNKHKELEEK